MALGSLMFLVQPVLLSTKVHPTPHCVDREDDDNDDNVVDFLDDVL
jgi:hypothetical protein